MEAGTGTMSQQAERSAPAAPSGQLRILAVGDDDRAFGELARCAESEGATLEWVRGAPEALRELSRSRWSVLLVALTGGDVDEQPGWWSEVLSRIPSRPRVVTVVESSTMGLALRAAELGVFDVLSLPADPNRFRQMVRRVRAAEDEKPHPLPAVKPVSVGSAQMVSESPAMLDIYRSIVQVAPTTATVLITGESGTGKELVAKAIHQLGPRSAQSFVAVNCAAIPENLLESELFGHEKGSFTGAVARKIGRFERANGGTLFLDEIGDMSLPLQSKILRAVQEREIERVGGGEPIRVDVRLVAATHRDLQDAMRQGRFREDLYYRIAVINIRLPRLSERGNDVVLLTAHFLDHFGRQYGKQFTAVTDRALQLLRRREWIGNVRELRNVIERGVLVADCEVLRADHLPEEWRTHGEPLEDETGDTLPTLREVEARHITRVVEHANGQIGEAARILGVHRNTLARKIKEYNI